MNADPGGPRLATQGEKHTFDVQLVSLDHFETTVYLYYRLTLPTASECRKSAPLFFFFFGFFHLFIVIFFGGDSCLVLNETKKKAFQVDPLVLWCSSTRFGWNFGWVNRSGLASTHLWRFSCAAAAPGTRQAALRWLLEVFD